MPDPNPTSTPTPAPLANSSEARLPTGEIRDLQAPISPTTTEAGTTSSASTTSESTEPKPADKSFAPETYTDFKLPEGAKVDKARLDSALPIFKEANLSQDSAQKLVDWYVKQQTEDAGSAAKLVAAMHEDWGKKLAADPEIGSKLPSVSADIGRVLAHLGPGEQSFRQAMDLTGAGNHPDVIKGLYKLSSMINEGRPVTGTNPSPHGQAPNGAAHRPSAAAAFYPNLPTSSS